MHNNCLNNLKNFLASCVTLTLQLWIAMDCMYIKSMSVIPTKIKMRSALAVHFKIESISISSRVEYGIYEGNDCTL